MSRAATLTTLTATAALAAAASAGAASSEDRYGPPHAAPAETAGRAAPMAGWLSWSMKTAAPAPESIRSAPARVAITPPPAPPARFAAAALPTSLYSAYPARTPAPEAAPALARWAANAPASATVGQAAHFYSVHRQFGLSPDPIPLPRQFFADNAPDLAAPPPPLAPHPVPGTQAATSPVNTAANRARQVEIETADSAAN